MIIVVLIWLLSCSLLLFWLDLSVKGSREVDSHIKIGYDVVVLDTITINLEAIT
jgi:hypothetical protein